MPKVKKQDSDYRNKVYLTDSRDMRELPDGCVGLIVTSPPYFNIKDYAKDGRQEKSHSDSHAKQIGDIADFDSFIDELVTVWKECFRTLKPNGKLVINVPLMPMLKAEFTTHENRHIFDLNAEIQNSILSHIPGLHILDTYIWNRTNPSKKLMFGSYPYPSNFYAQNTIEFVAVYVKEGKAVQPSKEIKEASKLTQEEWVEFTKQIWNLPIPGKGDLAFGTHSALMPEALAERCIRLFSFVGEIVLDPFTGSGTTLRLAKRLNRDYVGYEVMDSYEEIINKKVGKNTCLKVERLQAKVLTPAALNKVDSKILNKVFNSDFSTLLKKIPDNSIDLVCVDPPYNLKKAEWDTFVSDREFLNFTFNWIKQVVPKIKPGGSFYIFNTPRNSAHILGYLESLGLSFQNWITWNKKDGFTSTKKKFLPEQETIVFVTKPGGEITFNADLIRVPYESTQRIAAAKTKGILKNGKRWFPNDAGRLCPDVWQISSERHSHKENGKVKVALHPTVKPIALMERIVLASTNEGDVVLDFFAGSGSTLVAAKRHKRNFVGCDADPQFVKIAKQRLKSVEQL
jgi:site-specific DNA-methyltransferase (cytosine-N4-specific)